MSNRQARRAAARALNRDGGNGALIHDEAHTLLDRARELHSQTKKPEDFLEAARIYRRLGDSGCSCVRGEAFVALGLMHHEGFGVEQDDEAAARFYSRAADHGEAEGMYYLGLCFFQGLGVPQNFEHAALWHQKGAAEGHVGAQSNLGFMYMEGHGMTQNFEKGLALLRQAAAANDTTALNNLAGAYERGNGVDIDWVERARFLEQAANLGDSGAQSNLGVCYDCGDGVEQNFSEAHRYYQMAAAQDNRVAFLNLAKLYELGNGVEKDLATAKYYLKRAAVPLRGDEESCVAHSVFNSGSAVSDLAAEKLVKLKQTCEACGEKGEKLRVCARCKGPGYCNVDCQQGDWTNHKKVCPKASTARADRNRAANEG
jgi:TPR repeat protein